MKINESDLDWIMAQVDIDYARKLSDVRIASFINKCRAKIDRTERDRRLSTETRTQRIKHSSQFREILIRVLIDRIFERDHRTRYATWKMRLIAKQPAGNIFPLRPEYS